MNKNTVSFYKYGNAKTEFVVFGIFFIIFYLSAYFSVSSYLPTSIPVHHDDYTNYAAGEAQFVWSWVRPLSNAVIQFLAQMGTDWLIWAIRFMTVSFGYLAWKLFCELNPSLKHYWITLLLFGVAIFSTPTIVWYGRYTGMITHLLSGCLGLAAVIFLFRAVSCSTAKLMNISIFFLLLSAMAKEDFILFYAISLSYAALLAHAGRKQIISRGVIGLISCILFIAAAKFKLGSSFLGVVDKTSTYYINTSALSVTKTVFRYLTGASDVFMRAHGRIVLGMLAFSAIVAIAILLRTKKIPKSCYFVLATLCIIAPYSVLPNHVSYYYEFIWLPMIVSAAFVALNEFFEKTMNISSIFWKSALPIICFFVLTVTLSIFDYPGRKGITVSYDALAENNGKIIDYLQSKKEKINQDKEVCIKGANSFSPWFMHNGDYLSHVMGLNAIWHIIIDNTSPSYNGMVLGSTLSDGQILIVSSPDKIPMSCLHINFDSEEFSPSRISLRPVLPQDIHILNWGPQSTTVGQGFNLQENNQSAIWFEQRGISNSSAVEFFFGDKKLSGLVINPNVVGTIIIPDELLEKVGTFSVFLSVPPSGTKIEIGNFEVIE